MSIKNVLQACAAIVLCELAGAVGIIFTAPAIPGWYAGLIHPAVNPPAWVFGPVWTTLYALMGVAAFLVWKRGGGRRDVRVALGVFALQLLLNMLWSALFFGLHSPAWALLDIAALWLAIVWTMAAFSKLSKPAVYLLLPYLLWVSFAAYLNYAIWVLN